MRSIVSAIRVRGKALQSIHTQNLRVAPDADPTREAMSVAPLCLAPHPDPLPQERGEGEASYALPLEFFLVSAICIFA
jgi:hypothetical protein